MTINEIGGVLYGEHWVTPVSQAIQVNVRTVQRWAAAETPANELPDGVRKALRKLAQKRGAQVAALLATSW